MNKKLELVVEQLESLYVRDPFTTGEVWQDTAKSCLIRRKKQIPA